MSDEELDKLIDEIEVSFDKLMTNLRKLNGEVRFFSDNIIRIEKERAILVGDIDYIMSK
jgi:hypothetical protein